jgi:hypothetical protein
MGILMLPDTDSLGDIAARAGAAMLGRFANASAVFAGHADPVIGWKRTNAAQPALGSQIVQSSITQFTCLTADLPSGIKQGAAVAFGAESHLVVDINPSDRLGWSDITLENA